MKNRLHSAVLAAMLSAFCLVLGGQVFAIEEPSDEAKEPTTPVLTDDPSDRLDFSVAEMIAVQQGQRKKPLQTHAFESIEQIVGRPLMGSTFLKVPTGEKTPAGDPKLIKMGSMDLYLSLWFFPKFWYDKPLILVSNNELRKQLLAPDAGTAPAAAAKDQYVDDKRLSVKDILHGKSLEEIRGPAVALPLKTILLAVAEKEEAAKKTGGTYEGTSLEKDAQLVWVRLQMVERIGKSDGELAVVPHLSDPQGTWISLLDLNDEFNDAGKTGVKKLKYEPTPTKKTFESYFAFRKAYKSHNPEAFREASLNLRNSLQALSPAIYPTETKLGVEVQYNNTHPFALAWFFYVLAAMFALIFLQTQFKPVYVVGMALYLIGLLLHIFGFALRCYIAGRPPVSNMYESVIWVGFGAVFFGLIFEAIYRKGYYMLAGSFAGFLCLALMDLVPVMVGNTKTPGFEADIRPLQPVLRDNFWLTVHVLTITLSYAAFMLAWGMGHITLFSHLLRPTERNEHRELHNLVYRIMQVGVLLLAIGTILGGVWAYYSWGRFWGWDPKETWAFIALMCYIVVLHGRFAGLWTNFGLAFGSVFCFQAIVMAWYGVNFVLGSGKHSYGAGGGGIEIVLTCVAIDMMFLAAASIQYLRHKNINKKKGDDDNDPDVDESARGRVVDAVDATENSARDPHIKFS